MDVLPDGAFDLVVSTDVLEHIEPQYLKAVLKDMRQRASRGVFLNISCGPSKQVLPDGRNAHLIIEKPGWWLKTLHEQFKWPYMMYDDTRKGLIVWLRR